MDNSQVSIGNEGDEVTNPTEEYVYAVLEAREDGDGYIVYELLTVGKSIEACHLFIGKYIEDRFKRIIAIRTGAHPSMNASNRWTYIGSRRECTLFVSEDVDVGGFVIEKFLLI